MRAILSYLVLFFGIVLAITASHSTMPTPAPMGAPATAFSANRAYDDIMEIGLHPHPVGSAEHDQVREYIFGRMKDLGLNPQIHTGKALSSRWKGRVISAPVANLVGVLPGTDRKAPALLVMAHYDSVPNSPGAADDTAGVATALEIARALKAGPKPARDVVFLISDGEELGLLGATVFFKNDPLLPHIGAVINFDCRGDAGKAMMYETGPNNAEAVSAYGAAVASPSANSLARAIYKLMPNGSDFTLAVDKGLPGLNFAFIGDESAYHSPLAKPWHLSLASVQHMGDQALAAAQAFIEQIPAQSADAVYSDLFGMVFVQYSIAIGWLLFLLTAGLVGYALWKSEELAPSAWGRGAAGTGLLVLAPSLVLEVAIRCFAGIDHFQRLSHFSWLLIGAVLLALGTALLVIAAVEQGKGRRTLAIAAVVLAVLACLPGFDLAAVILAGLVAAIAWFGIRETRKPAALWQTMFVLVLFLALALQIFLPEAAFALVWPLLVAAIVAVLRLVLKRGNPAGVLAAIFGAVAVTALAANSGEGLFTAVGVNMPAILLLPLLMLLPALLLVPRSQKLPFYAHGVVIALGVIVFGYGRLAAPEPSAPMPGQITTMVDSQSGKTFLVSGFSPLGDWEKTALGADARFAPLPWSKGEKVWWAPIGTMAVSTSSLAVKRDGKYIVATINTPPETYLAALYIDGETRLAGGSIDGKMADVPSLSGREIRLYSPGPEGVVIRIAAPAHGKIELRLVTTLLSPPQSVVLPKMAKNRMAFGLSGSTQTVQQQRFKW